MLAAFLCHELRPGVFVNVQAFFRRISVRSQERGPHVIFRLWTAEVNCAGAKRYSTADLPPVPTGKVLSSDAKRNDLCSTISQITEWDLKQASFHLTPATPVNPNSLVFPNHKFFQ